MSGLLHVGAPVVRQSAFGAWLIDDGSLVPQRAADRRAAFAEAAARTDVPPAGVPLTNPVRRIAAASRAGSDPTVAAPPAAGGRAPELPDASPGQATRAPPNLSRRPRWWGCRRSWEPAPPPGTTRTEHERALTGCDPASAPQSPSQPTRHEGTSVAMTVRTLPDSGRSGTAPVTTDTAGRPEYDAHALLAEIVIRFEHADLLPKNQPLPDPRGAHKAAADLLKALGITPVDHGMAHRIARRIATLAGEGR